MDGEPSVQGRQERVWGRVTEAWRQFQDAAGRVRTENQAI